MFTENNPGPEDVEKGTSPGMAFGMDALGGKEGVEDAEDVRMVIFPPGLLDGKDLAEEELSREIDGKGGHAGGG